MTTINEAAKELIEALNERDSVWRVYNAVDGVVEWHEVSQADERVKVARKTLESLLTPQRKRVTRVSISNTYAFFDRTGDDNGDSYRITRASRIRLYQACTKHMRLNTLPARGASDMAVYDREVTA